MLPSLVSTGWFLEQNVGLYCAIHLGCVVSSIELMFFILLTFFVDFYYGLKIRFLPKKLCISSLDHQNPLLSNCNNIMIYSMRKLTWHSCINYMDQCITNSYTSAIVYEYWPKLWNKSNKRDRDQCITK